MDVDECKAWKQNDVHAPADLSIPCYKSSVDAFTWQILHLVWAILDSVPDRASSARKLAACMYSLMEKPIITLNLTMFQWFKLTETQEFF